MRATRSPSSWMIVVAGTEKGCTWPEKVQAIATRSSSWKLQERLTVDDQHERPAGALVAHAPVALPPDGPRWAQQLDTRQAELARREAAASR